jgi:CMP-N-acetylneuraminic acid synthetase
MKIFIPIKHESQRVPKKNFRKLGSLPLYKHTLYKLKKYIVFVDTDSDEIIEEIRQDSNLTNVVVLKRPSHLCGNEVSVNKLIGNFLEGLWRGCSESSTVINANDVICQIHVTSPFLRKETLEDAYSFFESGNHDSVVGCNLINSRLWRKEEYGYCPVNHNPLKLEETQSLPTLYEENSAFYMFKKSVFSATKNRVGKNPAFYKVDYPENFDIDTEDNWEQCLKIYETIMATTI